MKQSLLGLNLTIIEIKSLMHHENIQKSVHEGVKYDCNHCDYRASQQSNITTDFSVFIFISR